jgi:hypothetical protein
MKFTSWIHTKPTGISKFIIDGRRQGGQLAVQLCLALIATVACVGNNNKLPKLLDIPGRNGPRGQFSPTPEKSVTFNVMAPLVFRDEGDFGRFRDDLTKAKALGVDGVSTDVWWGTVERRDNQFDWTLYDRLSNMIRDAGMKWVPILSLHQCGGNVGDDCDIPIPAWIETNSTYPAGTEDRKSDDLNYKSEQGNRSREYISPWGTKYVLGQYREFFEAFKVHFADKAYLIGEINVSLGPAGELRYPSYNSHDSGSGYPTAGALQSYSRLAYESFQEFVLTKYGNMDGVNKAWGTALSNRIDVSPPTVRRDFYQDKGIYSTYGIDFLTWYSDSLIDHGRSILTAAAETFADRNSPFVGINLGAKLPGVHWRMTDGHYAELSAGILRATADGKPGYNGSVESDYRPVLRMFKAVSNRAEEISEGRSRLILHFTCLEKSNDEDQSNNSGSRAMDQVFWIGNQANELGLSVKGENALSGPLGGDTAWNNIDNALKFAHYSGVTFLRTSDVVNNELAARRLRELIQKYNQ